MKPQELIDAEKRLTLYESGDLNVYEGLNDNNCYGTLAQEAFARGSNARNNDRLLLANAWLAFRKSFFERLSQLQPIIPIIEVLPENMNISVAIYREIDMFRIMVKLENPQHFTTVSSTTVGEQLVILIRDDHHVAIGMIKINGLPANFTVYQAKKSDTNVCDFFVTLPTEKLVIAKFK
jgi:hypothetical protein